MKSFKINKKATKFAALGAVLTAAFFIPTAAGAVVSAFQPPCTQTTNNCLDRRVDALEAWVKDHEAQPVPTQTVTVTASPTTTTPATTTSTTTQPTTATPTETTAPPTTTTPPPAPAAWPDASTTGVPAGTTLTSSGGLAVTVDGTVIDGKDIRGGVAIRANNVTIKNSRITGTDSADWALVNIADGKTGTKLDRVEINGGGLASTGIYGSFTGTGLNIWNTENGATPDSNSILRDSWIHNLKASGDPHYDGIEIDGGGRNNILIEHNYINMDELNSTATVMLDNYFGPLSNVTVNNNKLIGGGWTVYIDGRFTANCPCAITNVKYTNNRIDGGYWGHASIDTVAGRDTYTWSGNVVDSTGATIPNP